MFKFTKSLNPYKYIQSQTFIINCDEFTKKKSTNLLKTAPTTNTPTHDHWSNQTDAGHGLNIHLYDYVNP